MELKKIEMIKNKIEMDVKSMKKNLLLVSLDTLRADVGYNNQSPFFKGLMEKGTVFLNTVSASPLTPVSHASILTGLYPFHHGIRHLFKEKITLDVSTIAEILKANDYRTGGVVSCPGMNKWYGFNRGFDYFDDEIPLLSDGRDALQTVDVKLRGTAVKRAPYVVKSARKWIENWDDAQVDTPFFLFLHFFDAHWPYEAPEDYGGDNIYEREVNYVLHYLESFMRFLDTKNLLDNTTIVCFSDHGEDLEGLYPNDKAGPQSEHPDEFGHGTLLYNQTQKVVFLVIDKDLPKNNQVDTQVRTIDITPTIVDLLDINMGDHHFDGISLRDVAFGRQSPNLLGYSETFYPEEMKQMGKADFRENSKKSFIVKNRYKIIVDLDSDKIEYFDLEEDPNEEHNLLL
ncbi:sulfatase [Robinsoniella sp. RHS]|uniref:sulfatase n=1 Tax=Robinsoniella sp. RHS TaxID=1504536 RepID=UPI003750B651